MKKFCTECKVIKDFSEFSRRLVSKDGLQYKCKSCMRGYSKNWRNQNPNYVKNYCQENSDKIKEYFKNWQLKNPDYSKKQSKKWRLNNLDHISLYNQEHKEERKECAKSWRLNNVKHIRQYKQSHKKEIAGSKRKWQKENSEHLNNLQKKRYWSDPEYYRLKQLSKYYGSAISLLKQIRERDKVCQLCGSDQRLEFDHIWPQSEGGKGTLDNLQILCKSCNIFKSNHFLLPDGGMMKNIK